jgi:hypothetical protein
MLFREIIAVYCENHTGRINTVYGQNVVIQYVKSGGKLRCNCPCA